MAAVSALVLGASRAPDMCKLGMAFNLYASKLQCRVWQEWVPSASNIADDGSRRGPAQTSALSLGVTVTSVPLPSDARQLLQCSPQQLVASVLG